MSALVALIVNPFLGLAAAPEVQIFESVALPPSNLIRCQTTAYAIPAQVAL